MDKRFLEEEIIRILKTVFDPEIPVDIYELGLIYEIIINDAAEVNIKMTLTSPACPVAGSLVGEVQHKVENIAAVKSVNIELVWDPPWDKEMMTEEAKLNLGFL